MVSREVSDSLLGVLKNDAPFAFSGSVSVRILNVVSGKSANVTSEPVSLPVGPKLSRWFCAEPPPAQNETHTGGDERTYTVRAGIPTDRSNFTSQLTGKAASEATCEAACNTDPKCLGFTQYNRYSAKYQHDCWIYSVVPSLTSNTGASFHQKPGGKPIPGPQPAPTPPPSPPTPTPPTPTPPPPPAPVPYPEPAQLNCTSWPETAGWAEVGCDTTGTNCVLIVEVHNSNSSAVSTQAPAHLAFYLY